MCSSPFYGEIGGRGGLQNRPEGGRRKWPAGIGIGIGIGIGPRVLL